MKHLQISPTLSLPADAVTQKLAFLARTGAGKTYAAMKLCEEMLAAGAQVVALDPVGVWWGLRLAADGKGPGFTLPVFGGEHGDVPLEPKGGALVADLVVDRGVSAVLDVSMFESKAQHKQFATDFAERLFFRKKAARSPLHLFFEEAQEFVPQFKSKGEERMLGAFERLIKLGRNYGVGASLISQRPQAVNKDVLNQTECLFALQTTGPQERKAVAAWIHEKGLDADIDALLPKLRIGEAHVWSPQWLGVSETVKIGRKRTFDASATPEFGARETKPKELTPVDVDEIRAAMAEVVQRAEENDPGRLKKRVAELERELKKAQSAKPETKTERVEVPAIQPGELLRLESQINRAAAALDHLDTIREDIQTAVSLLRASLERVSAQPKPTPGTFAHERKRLESPPAPVRPSIPPKASATGEDITAPQQRVLDALQSLRVLGVEPVSKSNVAVFSDQSPTSSGFANNLGSLRSLGLIDYPRPGFVAATDLLFPGGLD
jgi:hypothetical protein